MMNPMMMTITTVITTPPRMAARMTLMITTPPRMAERMTLMMNPLKVNSKTHQVVEMTTSNHPK